MEIHIRPHKGKGVKPHAALRRNPVIQLSDAAAAKIPWIFVLRLFVLYLPVDLLKPAVGDDRLAAQNQLAPIGYIEWQIAEHTGIARNHLAYLAVSSRHRLLQRTVPIGQHNGQPVQLPRENPHLPVQPVSQFLPALCFRQRKHGGLVPLLRQLIHRLVAYLYRRAVRKRHAKLFFQFRQFIVEPVILKIRHDLLVSGIVSLRSFVQKGDKLPHPIHFIFCHISPSFSCLIFRSNLLYSYISYILPFAARTHAKAIRPFRNTPYHFHESCFDRSANPQSRYSSSLSSPFSSRYSPGFSFSSLIFITRVLFRLFIR